MLFKKPPRFKLDPLCLVARVIDIPDPRAGRAERSALRTCDFLAQSATLGCRIHKTQFLHPVEAQLNIESQLFLISKVVIVTKTVKVQRDLNGMVKISQV